MKANFKWTVLAMAVSAMAFGSAASAQTLGDHTVEVDMSKSQSTSSSFDIYGLALAGGLIWIDSAALSTIDNIQSVSGNLGLNYKLENDASIADDVASYASGNLGFNVAAGDNNAQDNAAALSAADSSFAFGMSDAEVFVNQSGSYNATLNEGVSNTSSIADYAFSYASGNIGVNVASGNNNEQKNALSASVANSAYAQASISSNQVSSENAVANLGSVESGYYELGASDLIAQMGGGGMPQYVSVDASNTASLSGAAFSAASGNIGVNVASGAGNLQANSLALAVAQP